MDKTVYGTLIIANDYNTYINFKSLYDSNNIFRNRVFDVGDATGLNTILLAPTNFNYFNTFSRIIFLDPLLNIGYLSVLQHNTKSTIYLPHMPETNVAVLKDVSLEREIFGKYFRLMQFACENKITGYYCYNFYKNILAKTNKSASLKGANKPNQAEYNYLQFSVCLEVFKELGIVVTNENDTAIIQITDKKNPLNASSFYNRLMSIKLAK